MRESKPCRIPSKLEDELFMQANTTNIGTAVQSLRNTLECLVTLAGVQEITRSILLQVEKSMRS